MTKKLNSGIEVESDQYYKLLDWKDKNMSIFSNWCFTNRTALQDVRFSINNFNKKEYNSLVKFAGI